MEENRKRHCWECLRRSLVCDFTQPACNRCSISGIACPGYSDTPPFRLKWLAPGRVKYRKRKLASKHNDKATSTTTELSNCPKNVPTPSCEIKTDAHVLVDAVEFCVYKISPTMFQMSFAFPDYIRLGIVCMTLSHRMNWTRNDPQSNALAKTFFHYRGLIIRSLSDDLNVEKKRTGDLVIAGILTLLLTDAQQGASSYWRCHIEGIKKIIMLRGGIRVLAESTSAVPLLLCFVFISVMGDTTSPSSDLAMTPPHLEELDLLLEQYGGREFTFQTCPPPMFAEIIKINHLRARASKYEHPGGVTDLIDEAYEILSRIETFSSEQWAESKLLSKEDWILQGNVYRTAVALYCISSLQSVSVLPQTSFLRRDCAIYGQLLQVLLNKALSYSRSIRFMLWPLVVLGIEAVHGDTGMRAFVQEQLLGICRYTGTYVPVTAKNVLERFWASGETRWDACFDKPYALTMLPAVDVSELR